MSEHHSPRDPHQILGVSRGANREQINAAYRRALRRLHPDTRQPNGGQRDGVDRGLTMADLQHARQQLLRRAEQRGKQQRSEQQRSEQQRAARRGAERWAEQQRWAERHRGQAARNGPRAAQDPATDPWLFSPRRGGSPRPGGYHPYPGEPDIIAGPVRYHGPSR